jgi:ATP-dependent DNA ligase
MKRQPRRGVAWISSGAAQRSQKGEDCERAHSNPAWFPAAFKWVTFRHGMLDTRAPGLENVMPSLFIEPCLPTISRLVPTGPQWAYEIKHDGFRFLAVRQGKQLRVYSRGGHDWSKQLLAIADAMQALPARSAVIDGAVPMASPTSTA